MSSTKKATISAVCLALCCVLPQAFHPLGLGGALSPMHLPVLLCGLICGYHYGALCGVLGPVLSHLISGMPATAALISMVPELCAYGLFAGLFLKLIHTGRLYPDLYLALVPAMVLGRVVGGAAKALFFLANAKSWSVSLWVGAYFVDTLPGAVLQLILLPVLVSVLMQARAIPARYPLERAQ